MYIGEPHNVPAITPSLKNLANPKSASLTINCVGFGADGYAGLHKRIFCGLQYVIFRKVKNSYDTLDPCAQFLSGVRPSTPLLK
jgi:hypothetical protein